MPTEGTPEQAQGSNAGRPPDDEPAAAATLSAPTRSAASPSADAVARAMAELRSERPRGTAEPADRYWLRVGLAVGVSQPGRASLLLGALEPVGTRSASSAATAAAGPDAAAGDVAPQLEAAPRAGAEDAAVEADAVGTADAESDPSAVPVRSMLLTRSAELPAAADAETRFGWVSQLTPNDIRRLGHTVTELLANGGRRDLERGFGLAWSAGANLPREDLRQMFGRFAELELAVSGVLGGRDLLSMPQTPESGVSALLSVFLPRTNAASSEASAILEREGVPARRGLVAVWNAWIASRYRDRITRELFDELVGAWAAVIGPLPEA